MPKIHANLTNSSNSWGNNPRAACMDSKHLGVEPGLAQPKAVIKGRYCSASGRNPTLRLKLAKSCCACIPRQVPVCLPFRPVISRHQHARLPYRAMHGPRYARHALIIEDSPHRSRESQRLNDNYGNGGVKSISSSCPLQQRCNGDVLALGALVVNRQ